MEPEKIERLFCVQIRYMTIDGTYRMHRLVNYNHKSMTTFRNNIFINGLQVKGDEPETWDIICPAAIHGIRIYQQTHFFNAAEEDKPLYHSIKK